MTSLRNAFLGSRSKRGLLVAAAVAGSAALTATTASAGDVVTPPSLNYQGCPKHTVITSIDPFGAFDYTWTSGFSTTHGDGATYHVTRGLDGRTVDEGSWSYWC